MGTRKGEVSTCGAFWEAWGIKGLGFYVREVLWIGDK